MPDARSKRWESQSKTPRDKDVLLIIALILQVGKGGLESSSNLFENTQVKGVVWRFEPKHSDSRTHMYCRRGGVSGERGVPFLTSTLCPPATSTLLKGKGQVSGRLQLALLVSQLLKPRAAKRVRPRALISHQITVSGSSRRQGSRGLAGVTGRGSPCRSAPHHNLASPGSGGGYHQAAHTRGRGVGTEKGRVEELQSPAHPGRRGQLQSWCRYGGP